MPPKKATRQAPARIQARKPPPVSEESDYELADAFEDEEEDTEMETDTYDEEYEEERPPPKKRGRAQTRSPQTYEEEEDGYHPQPEVKRIPKKAPFKRPAPPSKAPAAKKPAVKKGKVPAPKKPAYYEESGRKTPRNEVISEEHHPVMNMSTKPEWIYCSYDLGHSTMLGMVRLRVNREPDPWDYDALQFSVANKDEEKEDYKFNLKIECVFALRDAVNHYCDRLESSGRVTKNTRGVVETDYDE